MTERIISLVIFHSNDSGIWTAKSLCDFSLKAHNDLWFTFWDLVHIMQKNKDLSNIYEKYGHQYIDLYVKSTIGYSHR